MPNEEGINANEGMAQGQAVAGEAAPAPEPEDLAAAFAQLRQANSTSAQSSVGTPTPDEPQAHAGAGDSTPAVDDMAEPMGGGGDETPAADASVGEGNQDVGGSAADYADYDYSPAREQILRGVQQQAMQNVVKRFNDNGIRSWEIADLYEKDERSGRVTFRNPDDESRPFQSRAEAQQFVDAMNKQIADKMRSEVRREQQQLMQQARPALSMIDFVPVYQSMNDAERSVFDELITPYAARNRAGEIVGFNVDLRAAAAQAQRIAGHFAQAQPKQQQQQQAKPKAEATGPAMDMSSGTGEPANEEPKDLSEAFAILNKQKKQERKK